MKWPVEIVGDSLWHCEERTDFSSHSERSLWSKIAKFVFLPWIITKHLTPLMNSLLWIMGVENGKQEIARWRDRLSLSEQLTAELEQHHWGSSKKRNDKKYNGFHCIFSNVLDVGPDTSSAWKTGTKHGCLWEDESLAVLHTGKWHVWDFPQGFIFLVLSFFVRRKSINLEALDLHPQGCKLARMAFFLW